MKLKVTSAFRDKDDHVTVYDPDTVLEVKDKDRAQSLIDRNLCKEFKGKTAPAYILGNEEEDGQPDTVLEVKDKDRAQSLIDRNLCKEFKGKTVPAYIRGKATDEQPDEDNGGKDENPDTGAPEQQ